MLVLRHFIVILRMGQKLTENEDGAGAAVDKVGRFGGADMALSQEKRRDRQQKLLAVAEGLIRQGREVGGFSMAQLAAAGGVSPATPYNLLGTKADILAQIVRAEFARFEVRLSSLPTADPLERLLLATGAVVDQYAMDRAFYQGLYSATLTVEDNDVRALMGKEGHLLWEALVEDAISSGQLAGWVRAKPLTDLLLRIISVTTQTWLADQWSSERFAIEMRHAVTLLLAAAATPDWRERLVNEAAAAHSQIE